MCFANITFINHNQRTIIGRTFCSFCVLVFSHVWTTDHAFSRHNRITLAAMNRSQMRVKQTFREMSILFSYWVSGCSVLIKFLEDVKSWHHEYISSIYDEHIYHECEYFNFLTIFTNITNITNIWISFDLWTICNEIRGNSKHYF